jgi:hypothetical protein
MMMAPARAGTVTNELTVTEGSDAMYDFQFDLVISFVFLMMSEYLF